MASKPKARSPAKPKKEPKEKTQRERFIETARAFGVDETGEEFQMAIEKLVPPRRRSTGG